MTVTIQHAHFMQCSHNTNSAGVTVV